MKNLKKNLKYFWSIFKNLLNYFHKFVYFTIYILSLTYFHEYFKY